MASRRRPRTRVYDCNFHIGESYYKPVMDSLDRKYARKADTLTPAVEVEDSPSSRVSRLLADRESTPSSRANRLMAEFEANGIEHHKPSRATFAADDDAAIDAEFEETMKRIKASRASRNAELEEEFNNYATKKKISIADQLLDSVGLNNRTKKSIEDEVIFKHKNKKYYDEDGDKTFTKWTAVRPGAMALQEAEDTAEEVSAVARARKSRARLQDIDAELEDLAAKGAARQKRVSDLKALVGESSESSSAQATASVKITKKVSVKSTAEKKQVSF